MKYFLTISALILSLALGGCLKKSEEKTEEEPWFLFRKKLGVWGLSMSKDRMSIDSRGDIYVSLYADGNFLFKYDRQGNMLWKENLAVGNYAESLSMTVDARDNIYVMGRLGRNIFMLKRDSQGGALLDNRVKRPERSATPLDMAVDSRGNFYTTATTWIDPDEFPYMEYHLTLFKFGANGDLVWRKDILDGEASQARLAVDGRDNVYIIAGMYLDFFKYDADGNRIWQKRLTASALTYASAMFADKKDNIYIAGDTWRDMAGESRGGSDIFWLKYNADGALLAQNQGGTSGYDRFGGAAVDGRGNLRITAVTAVNGTKITNC